MFTGLIEGMGSITRVAPVGPDAQLTISPPLGYSPDGAWRVSGD